MPTQKIPYGLLDGRYVNIVGDVMTGALTVPNLILPDGGTVGQAAGPLLTFDDTLNYLEITGCWVGIGTAVPSAPLHVSTPGGGVPAGLADPTLIVQSNAAGELCNVDMYGNTSAAFNFGTWGDEDEGQIQYLHGATRAMFFKARGVSSRLVITGSGVGVLTAPDSPLEVLHATDPQLRITQADGAQYITFQCTGASQLTINSAGNETLRLTQLGVLSVDASGVGVAAQVDEFDDYDDPVEVESLLKGRNIALMEQLGIMERKDKGGYMWRLQPLLRLYGGAIYQLNHRNKSLEAEVAELRSMVEALAG